MDPDAAYEILRGVLMLDGQPTLNLASFVTTWMEPQAEALIHDTLRKNHIDHEEYPAAALVEETCVHMMRVVVRVDLSRRMIDLLLLDLLQAWEELATEQPPDRLRAKADVWTHPQKAAGQAKQRTHQRRG